MSAVRRNARVRVANASGVARYILATVILTGLETGSALAGNLVGYWNLNEGTGTSAADTSGSNNSGTLTNSPTWTTGKLGGAISFNGTTQAIEAGAVSSIANLRLSGMTVAAWIKTNGSGGRIVDKDNNDAGWFFGLSSSKLQFAASVFQSAASRLSTGAIATNTWVHVAATWAGGADASTTMHFYINGAASDGTPTAGSGVIDDDAPTPLTIGNRPVDHAKGFNGVIDEVRVYNRVLSASEIQALADVTAPSAPTGASATAAGSTQINLAWTAATDNVAITGYSIERCTGASCSTFVEIANISPATTYSDTGRVAATTYRYRIRAYDAANNLSSYSSIVSATTTAGGGGDAQAPTTPTGVSATAASSTQVNLSWTASTDNVAVAGYAIERCTGSSCTTFAQIGTGTTTSYSDTGRTAATTYRYRIRAYDAVPNYSAYSSIVSATTPAAGDTQAPSTPTGLTATVNATQISLAWNASTDNVAVVGYTVERCSGASCSNFASINSVSTNSYVDSNLTAGTSYSYRVRAYDAVPNYSGYSNVAGSVAQDCD